MNSFYQPIYPQQAYGQSMYQPVNYPRQTVNPTPCDNLQFVQGIESAQAYQMPPNSKQLLMDANKARFYLVETDASGMKAVKAYDFTEACDDATPQVDMSNYITRDEFELWKESLANEPAVKQNPKRAKQSDATD